MPYSSGASRGRSAAGCCCDSRTTIAAAAVRPTSRRCWRISSGSGSIPTQGPRGSSARGRRPSARAIAEPSTKPSWAGSPPATRCMPAPAPGRRWRGRPVRPGARRFPTRAGAGTARLVPGPGRGIRVALERGEERFEDALLGEQRQEPAAQCGDLLLRDRLGQWSYQFAVTVDDRRHGVDLVVRGADLLASTGRQIRLARLLGPGRAPGLPAPSPAAQAVGGEAEQSKPGHRSPRAPGSGATPWRSPRRGLLSGRPAAAGPADRRRGAGQRVPIGRGEPRQRPPPARSLAKQLSA